VMKYKERVDSMSFKQIYLVSIEKYNFLMILPCKKRIQASQLNMLKPVARYHHLSNIGSALIVWFFSIFGALMVQNEYEENLSVI
jgi:hypothetical protein